MRNIWAVIVGVFVVVGAGVALYHAVDGETPSHPITQAAAPAAPQVAQGKTELRPSETFSDIKVTADDFVMGKADAPVTLIEYASLTCPHCAHFNTTVLPTIIKDYVDKGLVRYVYRDFPLDNLALTASVIARCAGRDRYFGFIDTFFSAQRKWAADKDPVNALSRLALLGGMSKADFDACLKKKDVIDAVLKQRLEANKKYKVDSTPTLLINGNKYAGALTLEEFKSVVTPMLKKK